MLSMPISKNNWIESEKYCQENARQERYASINYQNPMRLSADCGMTTIKKV